MVELISGSDSELLKNSDFVKNARLYKDMLAFYDAYCALAEAKSSDIPNYCRDIDGLSLNGVCLFMLNHAAELGFESLELSLDYLKVIYYTLASYSADGVNMPSRQVIEQELNEYRGAGQVALNKCLNDYKKKNDSYKKSRVAYEAELDKYSHKIVASKVLEGMSISLIIVFFVSAMLMFTFYFVGKFSLSLAILCSALLAGAGFAVFFTLRYIAAKLASTAHDFAYELQTKKRDKNGQYQVLSATRKKLSRLVSEKYECEHNLNRELFAGQIDYGTLFKSSKDYADTPAVEELFRQYKAEAESTLAKLYSLPGTAASKGKLGEIYSELASKEWLYNSNAVRYEFLRKFFQVFKRGNTCKLNVGGADIDPFNLDLKKIAKQKVAYLKSAEDLFLSTTADKLSESNFIKSDRELELYTANDSSKVYGMKCEYIKHFYDHDKLGNYNNLFYGKTFNENVRIPQQMLQNDSKLPYLPEMSLRLAELKLGLENCESAIIKKISGIISDQEQVRPKVARQAALEQEPSAQVFDFADELENHEIMYHLGNRTFVGYLLGNI